MKPRSVSVEQLALETSKVVEQARRRPIVVRAKGKPALVLRPLLDDDLVDELLLQSASFRTEIRAARRRRAAGGGISLAEARRRLRA